MAKRIIAKDGDESLRKRCKKGKCIISELNEFYGIGEIKNDRKS